MDAINFRQMLMWLGRQKVVYRACMIAYGSFAVLFALLSIFAIATDEIAFDGQIMPYFLIFGFVALFGVAAFVLRFPWWIALRWYVSDGNLLYFFVKTMLTFVAIYLALLGLMFGLENIMPYLADEMGISSPTDWRMLIILLLFVLVFIFIYFFMILFFFVYAALIIYLMLFGAIWLSRFILLRVIKHNRGPVLGLAGLLIAIGAVLEFGLPGN
ncbi:MAG: hypothetical protein ABJM29_15595 [Rhizobiaceae bacterium]